MITYVTAKELGSCPAAVLMDDGTIEINRDVWNLYTPFEQQFILAHEAGHYLLQTSSEEAADLYALQQMHRTQRRSLKQSIGTLVKMGNTIPASRVEALYREALKMDAQINGNQRATQELQYLSTKNNQRNMRQSKYNMYHRADGQSTTAVSTTESEYHTDPASELLYADTAMVKRNEQPVTGSFIHIFTDHRPGLQIGSIFLDLHTIISISILVVLCMIYKKK